MARGSCVVAGVALLSVLSLALRAQRASITLSAIDGRNGKAMPHQRLLVFMGRKKCGFISSRQM